MALEKSQIKKIAENKKAYFQYHVIDRWEAGIVLIGDEVKAIRHGNVNFKDSYVVFEKDESWIHGFHISYTKSYGTAYPDKKRKLLLHKSEIRKISSKVKEKGLTIIPLSIYFKNNHVKLEIGSAKGKTLFDKRKTIKEKDINRSLRNDVW